MSLIDLFLQRRVKLAYAHRFQPRVELLEERQCLSVAAPVNIHLAALAPTQVKVMWNTAVGVGGYSVFLWDGTNAVLKTTVAGNIAAVTVAGLKPNQVHWFAVEAFDFSTTARSAWVSIKTHADAITAPTSLRVGNITQNQLGLAWTNATGATGYRIYTWDGVRSQLLGSTTPAVPAFTVKNLTPGITYYFYVQAFNNTNSANSPWVSATTPTFGLASPSNLKTNVLSASTIALSWKDGASETGYRVYRWNGVTGVNPVLLTTLAGNTTGYQAIGLLPGKTYWFYIQAFNVTSFANTGWVSATTLNALALQPPTAVYVDITGSNSVALSWVEPARATGYAVFVWTGSYWANAVTVSAGTHSVPITGLVAGRTYRFIVQSFTANFAEVANSSAVLVNL
ncbi:MAG: fibronectin type III domain-containing protein [Gemmataceae bacterium]|nr:fibronectin type III domain-containing protein [Gemmataceae bacterium]